MQLTIDHERGFDTVPPNEAIRARPNELARALHRAALGSNSLRVWFAEVAACIQPVLEQGHGLIAALVEVGAARCAVQQLVFVGSGEQSSAFTHAATLAARVVAQPSQSFSGDGIGQLAQSASWQAGSAPETTSGEPEHHLLQIEQGRLRISVLIPSVASELTPERRTVLGMVRAQLQSALALRLASHEGSDEEGAQGALDSLRRDPGCQRASPATALALWRGLVNGPWSLLAHTGNGESRTLLIRQGEPGLALTRPFTARERAATEFAIQGHSLKWIGFEMGVALSTASLLVSSAIRKLGLQSRVELTELLGFARDPEVSALTLQIGGHRYALLEIPQRRLSPPTGLTDAEREVVLGVLSAKSNAEIAHTRRVSVNTIANQLRAVYQKLGVSGRSELICAC